MNIFDSPKFIAAYHIRGGSPFLNLGLPQQADLLSALRFGARSVPGHPGFNENDTWTNFKVKRLNDFLIEMVNIIVRPSLYFPIIWFLEFVFRSSLTFLLLYSFGILFGIPPFVRSLASIIFPVPILVLGACLKMLSYLYSVSLISKNNFEV